LRLYDTDRIIHYNQTQSSHRVHRDHREDSGKAIYRCTLCVLCDLCGKNNQKIKTR
jgi:hypothetical protein